ncbi:hypothetical protein AAE478_002870 [Parahypoxylon ruwenzoriense]
MASPPAQKPTRRPHAKTRTGCRVCKSRKVKPKGPEGPENPNPASAAIPEGSARLPKDSI